MRVCMEKENLNHELIQQISGYMRVGADFMLASAACGIPEKTANIWLKKANEAGKTQDDNIYHELYESIRTSMAHAEVIALQRLSAEGGSAGAKWLLEKMNPEKYSQSKIKKDQVPFGEWSPGKS